MNLSEPQQDAPIPKRWKPIWEDWQYSLSGYAWKDTAQRAVLELGRAEAALAQAREVLEQRWIDVEDRLPENRPKAADRKWYLVSDGKCMDFALYLKGSNVDKGSFMGNSLQFSAVKYWQEPPALPIRAALATQPGKATGQASPSEPEPNPK